MFRPTILSYDPVRIVPYSPTAMNLLLNQVMPFISALTGKLMLVQFMPSGDVCAFPHFPATTYIFPDDAAAYMSLYMAGVCACQPKPSYEVCKLPGSSPAIKNWAPDQITL